MKRTTGKNGTTAVTTDFCCPFCGAQAGAATNPPAVVHALPMCEQFRELEPADYLAAVNALLEPLASLSALNAARLKS